MCSSDLVASSLDITSGLPRVEEIFEARVPRGQATMSEIDGVVLIQRNADSRTIVVTNTESYSEEYEVPEDFDLLVEEGEMIDGNEIIAAPPEGAESTVPTAQVKSAIAGRVEFIRGNARRRKPTAIRVISEATDTREYPIPAAARIRVETGEFVRAGQQLTEGALDPQDVLTILGPEAVQIYLVDEVQRVYRSQIGRAHV